MLISVVISCYNGVRHIPKCVDSFLKQTYREIEIILYDDASTDGTWRLLQQLACQYPKTIRAYHGEKNKGPGGGKNAGLQYARGEYAYIADCDDYVAETYLENLVKTAQREGLPDIVIGGFSKVDKDGNLKYQRYFSDVHTALYQSITDWGKLFRLSYIRENELYIPSGRILEDILFHAAVVLSRPRVGICSETGYYYVQNQQSVTNTYMKKFLPKAIDQEFDYLIALLQRVDCEEDEQLLTYYAFRCVCWHLLKSGTKVGRQAMLQEYNRAIAYMERYFPKFKTCPYIKWTKPEYERKIVRFVVGTVAKLYKIHLAKCFFVCYASIDLSSFWPNM